MNLDVAIETIGILYLKVQFSEVLLVVTIFDAL